MLNFNMFLFEIVQQEALTNPQRSVEPQLHKKLSNLGQGRGLSTANCQGQTVSRRYLYSLGLVRPELANRALSRTAAERFGISRRGIHEVAKRVGNSSVRRALLENAGARRCFASETPKKRGEPSNPFSIGVINVEIKWVTWNRKINLYEVYPQGALALT